MVNHEKNESKAPNPSVSSRGAESNAMQIPSRGQKQFKTPKVKFLAVDEAIKLNSRDKNAYAYANANANAMGVRIGNRYFQSGPSQPSPQSRPSQPLTGIPERSIMEKATSSKCLPMEEDNKIRGSTDSMKNMHRSNDGNYRFELPANDSKGGRSTKKVQFEDRPPRFVASAMNTKPSLSMIMPKKDMRPCSTRPPSELKETNTKGIRIGKEAKLDSEKTVCLSNGENDSIQLPSNDSTPRSTKKVHFEDRPGGLVPSAINSKPSTNLTLSKKDIKSCSAELPSELREINNKGLGSQKEAKLDSEKRVRLPNGENDSIQLPSNDSTPRSTKQVHFKDRPSGLVASAINSKPSTNLTLSKKDIKPRSAKLPSELKEIEPKGFRPEQEAELDSEKKAHLSDGEIDSPELPRGSRPEQEAELDSAKKAHLSDGEIDSPELPSNGSTSGKLTQEQILATMVASVVKSTSSTNMINSQKVIGMQSRSTKLSSEMKEIRGPEPKAMLEDSNRGKGTSSEIVEGTSLITSKLHNYPPNEPAQGIIWKGNFVIHDGHKVYEGFFARSPENACPKASDFSKQMAQVLQFKVRLRSDRWPKIFQIDAPDENDIALYFYPGHFERSKENYNSLLTLMENYDMMIESRMEDVELIVFPSKWLPPDFQTLDGSHFMWGAFRTLKDSKMT